MTSHKPRHASHGPPASGGHFARCAGLSAAAASQDSESSRARLCQYQEDARSWQLALRKLCSAHGSITARHRTAPQEFRCPTTSCPQPQLSCGCFLLSALNKSSGRLLPPVLLSVPLISGERVVQAMPTRGLSQSEKYRIIESTTEPCPSAPDLHGFRMPPGMVTQLLPWAACSNASQPFC